MEIVNYPFLTNTALFRGMGPEEADAMLGCLGSYEKSYEKGDVIFRVGERVESMGMVLSGSVQIEIDDLWGNKTIFGHVDAGRLFAETYASRPGEPLMVNVVACERSDILFLNAAKLLTICPNACAHHNKLMRNLLRILAEMNLALSRRSLHTASRSIRGRLLSYLSHQAKQNGSYRFTIPFNRQQLADYLGVGRSAMSNELSKMQSEGLLLFEKNRFILQDKEPYADVQDHQSN